MASRMKDDEKNEKIIRGLLKLPGNKRCINCNSLGPQYVCTNFWTFICMNCSGVHREFTHRVKSVSMAKFTTQEVNALQEGGNERAREFYFKQWDPQRHSFPDSSNVDRLREFIRHAYVDRRYTGERVVDGPSRTKGEREDSYESRKSDAYQGGSRSPPYEEKYDRRSMDQPGPGRRNGDRNVQSGYEERQSPAYGRSPGRLDSATERHGNGDQVRSFEDRRVPDGPPRSEARSSGHQKELKIPSPPMVRPVREILGEDPPPLRVGEPPQTDLTKAVNGSLQTQRTASSNSLASVESIPAEVKRVDLGSLIDFDETPEPAVAAPEPAKDSQGSGGDWASFDSVQRNPAQGAPSNVTPLESALAGLSLSSAPPTSVDLFFPANAASQQPPVQQSLPPPVHLNQGQPSSQASLFAPPNTQPAVDDKTSGRRELPADLFSGSYPSVPYAGWQVGPRVPMGFAMQYPHQLATMPAFPPQPIRSTNPFDLSPQPTMPQAHSFPPMQGARPAMGDASFALAQGAGFGMSVPQWAAAPQRPFSHPSAAQVPLGGFPAQPAPTHQMPGTFPPLGYGQLGAPFGAPPSTDVHRGLPSGGGGNPFG